MAERGGDLCFDAVAAADVRAQADGLADGNGGVRLDVGGLEVPHAELHLGEALMRQREHHAVAEDDFRRAIDILAAVKHEVELARAYQGLAQIKERAGNTADAQKLRGKASDIFTRLRGAAQTE